MARIIDLFEAYTNNELPRDGGYIITERLDDNSRYARYEVISYGNVKDIYRVDEGILFQADGRKVYVLFEPLNYSAKHVEPAYRDDAHRVPYRFKEMDVFATKRQEKVMVGQNPVETYTAFTIANETGLNCSYVVYKDESTIRTLLGFFEQSLWKTLNNSRMDARKACEIIQGPLNEIMIPLGLK
ncbi:MAG: transposase [Spirochaetales bacterium]|nr:transposase [Spirochaetales bacterium]